MSPKSAALALWLCACAGAPEPFARDADTHHRLTLEGFREASPFVAQRLDSAVAWAVFPDVEDALEECVHPGRLHQPGAPARAVVLRCSMRPTAPAGAAYHVLVILEDPADLERLGEEGLDLSDAPHLAPHDDHEPPGSTAKRWVVTSALGGLLFDPWSPRRTLELAGGE
jgi:hypothetical protein